MKTSVELREERASLVAQARAIQKKAADESRDLNDEESAEFDRMMDDVDKMKSKIDRCEKLESAEQEMEATTGRRSQPLEVAVRERNTRDLATQTADGEKRKALAFRNWLKSGDYSPELQEERHRASFLRGELRDTVISTDAKGGYLITPVKLADDIVRMMNDMVFIRRLATAAGAVTTVTDAKKLGIRKKLTHMADADWTTEVAAVTEDTAMTWGRRDLEPYLCSKLAKISIRTLLLSTEAETEVRNELAYMFGVTEEKAFLTGDGNSKPLGVFTASANGISTGRDVAAAAATTFTADNLIDMKYTLKAPYRRDPTAAWIVSREFVKRVRKLKVASTTGGNDLEYIWSPGLVGGEPDRILDIPYEESEFAPNTFTTGLYVAVLGCFRFYRIAQVGQSMGIPDVMLQRLVELYAATNEVGFIGRRWVDGAPVLEEAFARLKMA